jgi:predicted kinase
MLKVILTVGAPASGKSSWSKKEIAKDPLKWCRISNDDLRNSFNGYVFSGDYEKFITDTRNFLLREALKRDLNVVLDNVNANKRHWETTCKIVAASNKDVMVLTKHFYADLETLLERNAKREGTAKVPDDAVKKFFKELGGKQFSFAKEKVEIFHKRNKALDKVWVPIVQDESLPRAVIFDNDGTVALIGERSPYNAENCDIVDRPHLHVIENLRLHYKAGYKIIFVSGREEKDRAPTERFYQKHFPDIVEYQLFMRPTGNGEKDVVIKDRIFNEHIKGKYFVAGWYDDRLQVSKWVFESGLPLFRVNDPEASF